MPFTTTPLRALSTFCDVTLPLPSTVSLIRDRAVWLASVPENVRRRISSPNELEPTLRNERLNAYARLALFLAGWL
jgi:hypothetical protein